VKDGAEGADLPSMLRRTFVTFTAVGVWLLHGAAATAAIQFENLTSGDPEFEQITPTVPGPPGVSPVQPTARPAPTPPLHKKPVALARERVQAQPGTPGWLTDPRSRCSVWVWDPEPGETVTWVGHCRGGEASGEGEVLRQVGGSVLSLYTGTFQAGRQIGSGSRVYASGIRLEAIFENGRANGRGTAIFPDGERYEGDFKDDLPHGHGVRSWPNGAWYDGEWSAGQRDGQGTMQYFHGDRYEGGWRRGVRHGVGILQWYVPGRSGVYSGEWRNDQRHGFGVESFSPEDAVYEGQYADGRPQGHGLYVVGGRERYEGEVFDDGCMRTMRRIIRIAKRDAECR
jgi:hypothetical protein